jgi:uncharacterized iron-regulated protein
MKTVLPLLLPILGYAVLASSYPAAEDAGLQETVRQYEREIEAVRGLKFKAPVVAKLIARPKDADASLQGYYSLKDKALFVYDDVSGAYETGVLIHEMVHALQDQNFGLDKLHDPGDADDAALAKAALIEGDATFTMIEVLKKDQPKVAAILDAPLEKAKDLRKAFLYAQGARFVKALKDRGGWEAVNDAYRFSPGTTAEILHPGDRVSTIDLGPGKTVGELGVIDRLRPNMETAAASGWRGDRVIEEGRSKAWVLAFSAAEAAERFQKAAAKWDPPTGGVHAALARGSRVLVLDAPDEAALRTLLDRVEGQPPMTVYSATNKKTISFGELTDRLMAADLVCVGETHDSDLAHRVQLQIIKALFARDERLGVGMEMFQRPFQKEIDRYFKGDCGEDEFLKATEYQQRWGFDWSLYRPIVEFCRKNGVPLAALNVRKELTKKISKEGYDALSDDEKMQLGEVDFHVQAHRDYWYERLWKIHGAKEAREEQKERGYQVMTVWDEYMGASAAAFQKEREVRRMVVLAGSGHVERGFGIAERAAKRTGGKALTVAIVVGGDLEKVAAEPTADFVVVVK